MRFIYRVKTMEALLKVVDYCDDESIIIFDEKEYTLLSK
jgi:hypothetical protein